MTNILNFPATTIVDKSVPKNAFWQRADNQTELKEFLTREFESITWLYKLATSTLNVADGESVHEIDVFYCKMKNAHYSINPFLAMDKLLPRHTLYIIEYGESVDIVMQHKEKAGDKWRSGETEMLRNAELSIINCPLSIVGQTMDAIYTSLLSQVSGLQVHNETEYKQLTEIRRQILNLEKQIAALHTRISKEPQFNRKMELNAQLRQLRQQLAILKPKT